jgi:hypothetical protein
MSSQLSERGANLPTAGLAACVLGLALCPFIYIAIGALAGFAPAFSFVALPPLLISCGYLLYRFLSKPSAPAPSGLGLVAELVSWMVIVAFVAIVSNFTLQSPFERLGLSLCFFLLASVLCLPIVLMRRTALQQRLMQLPSAAVTFLLLVVVLLSATMAAIYLSRAPAFI